MKKLLMLVLGFGLLIAGTASASNLPKTTWQTYYTASDILVVHVSNDPNSAICWEGKAHVTDKFGMVVDNYQNQCVDTSIN